MCVQIYSLSAQSKLQSRGGISKKVDKTVDDTLKNPNELLKTGLDTLISAADSLKTDSLVVNRVIEDTIKLPMAVGDLTEIITYEAKDSIIYDIENEMIHLYNGSQVKYDETEISASETHFNYVKKTVTANSEKKAENEKKEKVVLLQDGKEYKGDKMVYNFESKKGKINDMLTTDDSEGFVHGEEVKINEHGELFGKNAYYTTCEHEEPHFHINVDKVKIIPDKFFVSGPANLVIADVPTPLVLPFAVFPLNMNENRSSGVIFPSYGQSPGLGFYLQQGGYYWAVNDYMDLALLGDIYTNGSWRASIASQYKMRYRYSGDLKLSIGRILQNDRITPNFIKNNEYKINWNHRQDAKARPNSTFSANVNITSSNFQRSYTTQTQRDLNNVFSSSISYNYNFPRSPFSLSTSARHSQNVNTNSFNLTLPSVNLNMSTIYPFEKKVRAGSKKWYENTKISYSGSFKNSLSTLDSLIFEKETYRNFETDITHSIPISTQFKLFKQFNLNPGIRYTEKWFFERLKHTFDKDSIPAGSETAGVLVTDTMRGFTQSREFSSIGLSLSTNLYGIFNFKRGKIKAIRHVLSPSISYNFLPDFSASFWKNYNEVIVNNENGMIDTVYLSRFIGSSTSRNQQSSLSFGLGNRFDMKVRTPKDSINKEKKIELLRSLNLNSSYNFAADSFKMANISMRASANFLNRFNLNFNSSFSPYVFDKDSNRRVDKYLLLENRQLARFNNATLTVNTNFSSSDVKDYFSDKGNESDILEINENRERFLDFNQQWNVRLSYSFGLQKLLNYSNENEIDSIAISQNNLNVTFDLNLTDKWKISGGSGYDFVQKEVTYTNLNITRDLHCWQMSFNLVPFGALRSYNFRINVKAAVLQDLKLTRVRSWYDF